MKVKDIIEFMDNWALPKLIDKWDNTGFQIGNEDRKVERILISLDLDDRVLNKALEERYDMIITHHPLIFKPLEKITTLSYKEKLVYNLIREDIAVYNAHTNLDLAKNGVNDELAKLLGLKNSIPLQKNYEEDLYKLVVFVPLTHADIIREVLGNNGAGYIGNYSHCTYNIEGFGTFLPMEGTTPYIGNEGELEKVREARIETIVQKDRLSNIIKEMLNVHPYEEVAYDIYPLENKGDKYGYGRVGDIYETSLQEYLNYVKEKLDTPYLTVYGNMNKKVKRVAVCGGSGSSFIHDSYIHDADLYITGDIKYHDAQLAYELGLTLVDAGHFNTEKVILPVIKEYLIKKTNNTVNIDMLNEPSPPYVVY
ncbi:Nif3-like dinuclear metal center hexameric protein [Tissierella sp. MSJ-40]|uniref:GTP cyclohydrolase 1 type 2 homolog n=1 Tax=Tissierella simiarum TaxID=2841534 RepID=A0ABS6E5P3_9FIRM|nr:Nif3-like dinuclear metal center hexameric protein [Tissierella simiarum]MBU5438241.1 Nif3-like dinuclear metal center hexameric protein [Tissierella simiarum]